MNKPMVSFMRHNFKGLLLINGASCLLEMLVMGFGLCNVLATFTRLRTDAPDPFLHLFLIFFPDDICIYTTSAEDYLDHLQKK